MSWRLRLLWASKTIRRRSRSLRPLRGAEHPLQTLGLILGELNAKTRVSSPASTGAAGTFFEQPVHAYRLAQRAEVRLRQDSQGMSLTRPWPDGQESPGPRPEGQPARGLGESRQARSAAGRIRAGREPCDYQPMRPPVQARARREGACFARKGSLRLRCPPQMNPGDRQWRRSLW